MSEQTAGSVGARLDAVRRLLRDGALPDAVAEVDTLEREHPDDVDVLYLAAVVNRYARRFDRAAAALDRLKVLSPGNGRCHQEEGHLLRAVGRTAEALVAYARACHFNPALEASYRARVELLAAAGRRAEAQQVHAALARLQALPKPLVAARDLLSQGKLLKAEDLCRAFLRKVPHHVEGMRLLAEIGMSLGVLDDAEFLLESAVALAPDNDAARIDYVGVLRKRQKFEAALAQARKLLARDPDNPRFRSIFAVESMQTGDYDTALEMFDRVLEQVPGDPATLTARGHALKTCGRTEAAVAAYRDAIAGHPLHGEAWYSLANLKTYEFDDDEIARMHALARDGNLGPTERVYLQFALGKAHEDRAHYEVSFEHYRRGNDAKRAQSRYDAQRMHEEFERQKQVCTAAFFAERAGVGHPAPDPIFIVGLPRAGSTLIEQILSSHSMVDGTLELPNVLSLSQRLRRWPRPAESGGAGASADGVAASVAGAADGAGAPGAAAPADGAAAQVRAVPQAAQGSTGPGRYPEVLAELSPADLAAFGEAFIEQTRIHRRGAPFFTDKMPNNFRHIGLIHLILPNAKIIDARRHPMACCFSGFKQLFAEGQEFSYSLQDIGRYYRDYVALMDHWDEVLPGRILRVMHEEVVDDLETQVRRLLDFCGLPFEGACLRYWETERSVRTPSSEQVRRPIFRDSVEQWRHYEPWLGPLKDALGPVLDRYPPAPSD